MEHIETLILGAGVSGLAAASALGKTATVLEREDRPGGLVRSVRLGDYWFDHVLHLLYFNCPETEARIGHLLGDSLAACPPVAWVETAKGVARFPLQLHLGGLEREAVVGALRDMAEVSFSDPAAPANFEEMLWQRFGKSLCELFFYPYNRKVWKRPLHTLAASGFTWNIAKPDFATVVRGALSVTDEHAAYNSKGWYPRPEASSPVRGMEVLTAALAREVCDLRLHHTITAIDLRERQIVARHGLREATFSFAQCIATLPLPKLISLCQDAPAELRQASAGLLRNRVFTGMFAIRGPRPSQRGHWRYYADESVAFNRVVYMHEFDPLSAPADGWGLLVEITEPAETPIVPKEQMLARIEKDLWRTGVLTADAEIRARELLLVDPAYVVFSNNSMVVVEQARAYLEAHGLHCLGRYGRWEYSSMSQVMTDGFALATKLSAPPRPAAVGI